MQSDVIDQIDDQIVSDLVRDGRASFRQLGEAVGLSPHATAERVRRLMQRGVIRGFTAIVDPVQLGRSLEAIVDVRLATATLPDQFEPAALALDAAQEVMFVTGRYDYQVRLLCRDADDLDRTVRHLRQHAGAAVTETRIVLRSTARTTAG